MNEVLLINIDPVFRSAYSALAAKMIKDKNKSVKISLICPTGCEFLAKTNLFEKILTINTEDFFSMANNSSDHDLQNHLTGLLGPFMKKEWASVINLSSNPLGAYFTHFLTYKEILGSLYKDEHEEMIFSNMDSFIMFNMTDIGAPFRHYAWLYQGILENYSAIKINRSLAYPGDKELGSRLERIKVESGKKDIVLIDSSFVRQGFRNGINFIVDLFKGLAGSEHSLPILLSQDTPDDSFLIDKLRQALTGQIHVLSSDPKTLLEIVGQASLVITNSFFTKTMSDLVHIKSIFIAPAVVVPMGDYSLVDGSLLLLTDNSGNLASSKVLSLANTVQSKIMPLSKINNLDGVYRSFSNETFTFLLPLGEVDLKFLQDWMKSRFLSFIESKDHVQLTHGLEAYKKLLRQEEFVLTKSQNDKALPDSSELITCAKLIDKYKPVENERKLLDQVLKFLDHELNQTPSRP